MKRLLSDKKYRSSFILNIAGIIFASIGWFLNELNTSVDGSNLQMAGYRH